MSALNPDQFATCSASGQTTTHHESFNPISQRNHCPSCNSPVALSRGESQGNFRIEEHVRARKPLPALGEVPGHEW